MSAASEAVSGNKVRPLGVLTWGAPGLAGVCSEHKVRVQVHWCMSVAWSPGALQSCSDMGDDVD